MINSIQFEPIFEEKKEIYTPYYCEENIYLLCKSFSKLLNEQKLQSTIKIQDKTLSLEHDGFAILITNEAKQICLKSQKIGNILNDYKVLWDYHVIFLHKITLYEQNSTEEQKQPQQKIHRGTKSFIYDFDSALGFYNEFENYFEKTFEKDSDILFRVAKYNSFNDNFCSDRSHMIKYRMKKKKKEEVVYQKPPPNYPPIINKNSETMNLFDYLDVKKIDKSLGLILKLKDIFVCFKETLKL